MTQVPTTDQIRTAIDSGATGEKVGYPDTAAAPLGTDAEAGGRPPTRTERAIEANAQVEHRDPVTWNGPLVYFGPIALVCVGIVVVGTLLAQVLVGDRPWSSCEESRTGRRWRKLGVPVQ